MTHRTPNMASITFWNLENHGVTSWSTSLFTQAVSVKIGHSLSSDVLPGRSYSRTCNIVDVLSRALLWHSGHAVTGRLLFPWSFPERPFFFAFSRLIHSGIITARRTSCIGMSPLFLPSLSNLRMVLSLTLCINFLLPMGSQRYLLTNILGHVH